MKLTDPCVYVPYLFTNEEGGTGRAVSKLQFTGSVDKRRVRRTVRKHLLTAGIRAPKHYIDRYIRLARKVAQAYGRSA